MNTQRPHVQVSESSSSSQLKTLVAASRSPQKSLNPLKPKKEEKKSNCSVMYSCFATQKVSEKHQEMNALETVCFVNHRAHQCSSVWWWLNWIIQEAGNEGRFGIGKQEELQGVA